MGKSEPKIKTQHTLNQRVGGHYIVVDFNSNDGYTVYVSRDHSKEKFRDRDSAERVVNALFVAIEDVANLAGEVE